MDAATILAIMIALQAPGRSIYSQIVVAEGSGPTCDDKTSLLCAAPRQNPAWDAPTRPETRDEGLHRYWTIAKGIEAVARRSTWQKGSGCQRSRVMRWTKRAKPDDKCDKLHVERPWNGTEEQLQRYLITVAYHESGFRRDIHAAKGLRSMGDAGRSICLGQIMKTRRSWKSTRGYSHRSLAGVDAGATARCLETASDYLGHARDYCASPYGPEATGITCILGTYGGVKSPLLDKRIHSRVRTYMRTATAAKLSDEDRRAVGLDPAP